MNGMHSISKLEEFEAQLEGGDDAVRELVRSTLQEILEEEMTEALGAAKSKRTDGRAGYRSGYYTRFLTTRVGRIKLQVPQDRNGLFRTKLFERYQRSEKSFVSALMQMHVSGVSMREVAKVAKELCGRSFSASTVNRINAKLETEFRKFAERSLAGPFPYLVLGVRDEKVRTDCVVSDHAILLAIGIDGTGRRQVLGAELAGGESHASWRRFLDLLRARGMNGVVQVVSEDHSGLTKAVQESLPDAVFQRCYVNFLRNARTRANRNSGEACIQGLRRIFDRPSLHEARDDFAEWLGKWQSSQPRLCEWVEENIDETLTFLQLPRQHHRRMRSTSLMVRLNREIRRRKAIAGIFPDAARCLKLVRALCAEIHESWLRDGRYLDMKYLRERH